MTLSACGFASIESAVATSYAAYAGQDRNHTSVSATTTSIHYTSTTNVILVAQSQQITPNLFATGIAELLTNLTSGNIVESQQTLSSLQASLSHQASQILESQPQGAPGLGGVQLGGIAISSVTGLFSQIASVLNAGNSAQALDRIHTFLLGSNVIRGNAFDATV